MFEVTISGTQVIFSKFFSPADREAVLDAIPQGTRRALFLDTAAAPELAPTIEALLERGVEVFVRDHHDEPSPGTPRAKAIAAAAERIRSLCGDRAVISNRKTHPSCAALVAVGEARVCEECGELADEYTAYCPQNDFHGAELSPVVVVADPDADGLTATMKACGVTYAGLETDADVLDGARAEQTADRLTPNAFLLVRAMASLPPYDAARPDVSEKAKAKLFGDFVAMVQGDAAARARLEAGVAVYEEGVREAERLVALVTDVLPGVAFVDGTESLRFDLATLAAKMEARPGCRVTVQRKSLGPIAAKHGGVQFSLAVVKAFQAEINLQELLPAGFVSSPEAGIISNTGFLLHVSEKVWNETVLPALRSRLA